MTVPVTVESESDKTRLRGFHASDLVKMFPGTSLSWWHRAFAQLVADGVFARRGKKHFGTVADLEAWLTRSHDETPDIATV